MGCGESKSTSAVQNKVDINKLLTEKPESARKTPHLEKPAAGAPDQGLTSLKKIEQAKELVKAAPENLPEKVKAEETKIESKVPA